MKRSHLFRESSRPSVPTLFVCLADPNVPTHRCAVVSYRRGSPLPSPLPPRFAVMPKRVRIHCPPTQHKKPNSNPIGS